MALGEEVRRRGSKRRQQQMDIMRACVLRASRRFHVESPLFHITYFHYQQRKLSAQGSFIGCTLTFCVKMSGGHVCVVTMLSCSNLLGGEACVGLQVKPASSGKISAAGDMNTLVSGPLSSSGSLPQGAA